MGRVCAVCGRTSLEAPRLGGITRYFGVYSHLQCWKKAQERGWIVYGEKGHDASINKDLTRTKKTLAPSVGKG